MARAAHVLLVLSVLGWHGGEARADDAADRARAKELAAKKRLLETERDAAQAGTRPSRSDPVHTPLPSTQTKELCTMGRACKTITVNQASNAGIVTQARIPSDKRKVDEKNRELARLQVEIDELRMRNPDAWASANPAIADDSREATRLLAIPVVIAIGPILISAAAPGTGQLSVNARILGAGNRPGVDGLQGDGFELGYRQERVISMHAADHAGLMTAFRFEIGGYRDAGAIGSIGMDVGPGVRSERSYLGATIGAHWTSSVYQSAGWFPVQVHAGRLGPTWALVASGGFGWRRDLPDDGSAASMITSKGPAGTTSSTFRIAVMRSMIQVGFSIDDFDGNRIGSFNIGYGRRLLSTRW